MNELGAIDEIILVWLWKLGYWFLVWFCFMWTLCTTWCTAANRLRYPYTISEQMYWLLIGCPNPWHKHSKSHTFPVMRYWKHMSQWQTHGSTNKFVSCDCVQTQCYLSTSTNMIPLPHPHNFSHTSFFYLLHMKFKGNHKYTFMVRLRNGHCI